MVVMAVAHLLVTGTALAEVEAFDNAGVLEQFYGPVHRRNRDLVVDRHATSVQLLDVGMVGGFRQHPRDDAALFGHSHAGGGAAGFDTGGLERGRGLECGHGSCLASQRMERGCYRHQQEKTRNLIIWSITRSKPDLSFDDRAPCLFVPSRGRHDKSRRIRTAFNSCPLPADNSARAARRW